MVLIAFGLLNSVTLTFKGASTDDVFMTFLKRINTGMKTRGADQKTARQPKIWPIYPARKNTATLKTAVDVITSPKTLPLWLKEKCWSMILIIGLNPHPCPRPFKHWEGINCHNPLPKLKIIFEKAEINPPVKRIFLAPYRSLR